MKLTKETIATLKNFSAINPGIILKKGNVLITKNMTNVVYGEATLNQDLEHEIGIYDLNSFLGILNLVGDEADITVDDRTGNIRVSNDRLKINYPGASAAAIVSPKGRVTPPASDVDYELSNDDLKQLMKMSNQLKVDRLEFLPIDGRLMIKGWEEIDKNNPNEMFCLDMGEYAGTADFHFFIRKDNMKLVATDFGDYKLSFTRRKAVWLASETVSYMIACDLDSSYTD